MSTFETIFDRKIDKEARPFYVGVNRNGNDAILYIAEAGNPEHEKAQRKYAKALAQSRHSNKKQRQILCKIISESILLDWKGFLDGKGNEIECTEESKNKFLNEMPALLASVMEFSTDQTNYVDDDEEMTADEALEDSVGN